jgi:hypothetical protein
MIFPEKSATPAVRGGKLFRDHAEAWHNAMIAARRDATENTASAAFRH